VFKDKQLWLPEGRKHQSAHLGEALLADAFLIIHFHVLHANEYKISLLKSVFGAYHCICDKSVHGIYDLLANTVVLTTFCLLTWVLYS